METLKLQVPQNTFRSFVESTRLVAIEGSTATIELSDIGAKDRIENRLARQLKQLLYIEGKNLDSKTEKITELRVVTKE